MKLASLRRTRRIEHLVAMTVSVLLYLAITRLLTGDWHFAIAAVAFVVSWQSWEIGYKEAAKDSLAVMRSHWRGE